MNKNYGKEPTLLKVTYVRPNKKKEQKECFQIIYMNDYGEVKYAEEEAYITIYFVKPEHRTYNYNKPEELMEHMEPHRCLLSRVPYEIAKEAGPWGQNILDRAIMERNNKLLKHLYKWPYCYGCDFLPEFYYMKEWYDYYPLKIPKLTRSYLDIETDLMDYLVDMDDIANSANAPVNVVTIILEETLDVYTFILRPYVPPRNNRSDEEYQERYALYEKQLKAHNELMSNINKFYEDLHKSFDDTYGVLNYHLREYENEIDLIIDLFQLINTKKPNFCLMWNMRFDIQYLLYRIIVLGYDPRSIMCSPEINDDKCYFVMDKSTFLVEKQFDSFVVSSFTQYLCQMRNYSSIRKNQHKLKSVKLNAIADRELKDRKVEYPENTNMQYFPYIDWILFIKYNIKDVLLQLGIERKVNDTRVYYMRSHKNLTPYHKIFKETHFLRCIREKYFEAQGWVQGNNLNTIDSDENTNDFYGSENEEEREEKVTFKGAINADPVWNDNVGQYLLGKKSNRLFKNAQDEDMGAFYPSIKIISNMDGITLLYKAAFENEEFKSGEFSNKSLNQVYEEKDKNGNMRKVDFTGEAVNTFVSGNILTFGYNYLNLPNIVSLNEEILKIINK